MYLCFLPNWPPGQKLFVFSFTNRRRWLAEDGSVGLQLMLPVILGKPRLPPDRRSWRGSPPPMIPTLPGERTSRRSVASVRRHGHDVVRLRCPQGVLGERPPVDT